MYPTSQQIGEAGERLVVNSLQEKGFTTKWDTKGPGATDVEAVKANEKYLIQVKSAIQGHEVPEMDSRDVARIKNRASQIGYQPILARVELTPSLTRGLIQYRNLNN